MFVLASRNASPPYRTQRMDFAVPWLLACCRLKSGMHAAPYLVRVAWSHPGGRALLAFAPTTFSIPLPSAVHCVYPAVRLQELWVRLDHLTHRFQPVWVFGCDDRSLASSRHAVKRLRNYFVKISSLSACHLWRNVLGMLDLLSHSD